MLSRPMLPRARHVLNRLRSFRRHALDDTISVNKAVKAAHLPRRVGVLHNISRERE